MDWILKRLEPPMATTAKLPIPQNFEGGKKFSFLILGFSDFSLFTIADSRVN